MYGHAEPPPRRRDNGLRADTFVALADVDPRLGEHLLDLLRLADIAAYLEPPGDPRVAMRYQVAGPIERLFVQSDLRRAAREVVLAAAKEAGADPVQAGADPVPAGAGSNLLDGIDTDAEFQRIMAGYEASAPARTQTASITPIDPQGFEAPDAARSDALDEPAQTAPDSGSADALNTVTAAELDARAAAMARAGGQAAAKEDERHDHDEHFVPPAAPPLPVPRAKTVGAVAMFLFGLLVIAKGDWLGLGSATSFPLGVIAVLVSIGLLIRGLHDTPSQDTDPDDGAIV